MLRDMNVGLQDENRAASYLTRTASYIDTTTERYQALPPIPLAAGIWNKAGTVELRVMNGRDKKTSARRVL